MKRFTLPRDMYYGEGALDALKDLGGKKAIVVVGGGSMKRFGFLDKVVNKLKEGGMEVELFENVEPDPSVETVMAGAKKMQEFGPDWIVALGGGSPIDAAKAMWAFYEYPEVTFEELCIPFNFPKLRKKARFAAVSSTSGTATEVTAFSVITDYNKGIKYPLADFEITPDVAILDPTIPETMPAHLAAYTGMDALTHAVEAYVSTANSPFTDPLAIKAIQMVFEYLRKSYNGDKDAREQMHYAQCLAGQAFTNALLGIVHSMAHKTGAIFSTGHIIHGYANAMYLPYVIQYNMKDENTLKRYAEIGHALNPVSYTHLDVYKRQMIDYALRRRFSFFEMEPAFKSMGFKEYQKQLNHDSFDKLISKVEDLNNAIEKDSSLGRGFCIGHSYFCGRTESDDDWIRLVINLSLIHISVHMGSGKYNMSEINEAIKLSNLPVTVFRPTHINRKRSLCLETLEFAKNGGFIDITCGIPSEISISDILDIAKEENIPLKNITVSSDGYGSWSSYDDAGNLVKIGVTPIDTLLAEIKELVSLGHSMKDVISLFTSNVADALKISKQKGRLNDGLDADLLILNEDLSLYGVIAKGEVLMEGEKILKLGTYENVVL